MDHYDGEKKVKIFGETKAGVKGIVDSGPTKIPEMFVHPPEDLQQTSVDHDHLRVPVIDLKGLDESPELRKKMIDEINKACEEWGFFQIVNHGIPISVMDELLKCIRRFHELPWEEKVEWYSNDYTRKVNFYSNGNMKASVPADWRDTLACNFQDDPSQLEAALPQVCRMEIIEYRKCVTKVIDKLAQLLSEALGLSRDYLASMGWLASRMLGHYYPVCPEPDLTLGSKKHSDISFLTLLLQDSHGGLQVIHQNLWLDVTPVRGALVVNIGDWMQIISNDKFKSVKHRVLATCAAEPRISVACFFIAEDKFKPYGPIKELISETNPPIYKAINLVDYIMYHRLPGRDVELSASPFRLDI